jgi:lysophospholipase L1-like esterase
MMPSARPLRCLAATVTAIAVAALTLLAQPATPVLRRVAIFGSSVASGTGDESGSEGYAGILRDLLQPRGWEIVNRSRGGDDTAKLMSRFDPRDKPEPGTRYLMPARAGYVVIALSLGNEGIRDVEGSAAKDARVEQYLRGIQALVARSRAAGMVPIVTLCYTRNDFTEVEYSYTRRVNATINQWDLPSVNLLGAVDDGTGKWVRGFWWDSLHPNAAGHTELATTFVPSLFEALERGKPIPTRATVAGFARLSPGAALTYSPDTTMHPFAVAARVRVSGNGPVMTISGTLLAASTGSKTVTRPGQAPLTIESTSLTPGAPTAATIGVRNGVWAYTSTAGTVVSSSVRADAAWHDVLVSHYTARGETLFFVDGVLAGRTAERYAPGRFMIGGPGQSRRMDVKDALVYRSALNADEAAALAKGTLLQASLEIYAPLTDAKLTKGAAVENRAQSLSAFVLEAGSATSGAR